ncbi:hypothetical protein PSN45_001820 [Yamadazyma tenuis]|uniref:Transcription initiation factor TFIID subunit 1 histone acetyltransferase domain-containing protein n=1 Tax=Candida tenuis (strain ATCC 10573 / BCRC 21748 / CBS 615 / JCM 9827 / NBRC 10315 / NRRL Y-1498 / VKM Y-70) TaxID=590646 RepID=G3BDZ3_CANTC|nr:uncharacterized protein CANTEDRAFT_95868 [Yamadazyma tenuis ATCC 10573]EGV60413.1 hypothetical protein CANTEDRAFT_95868 [Yamadazyma tenuis ATCC 10573]WEJ94336.1 hypothetical protein PSN45_001820 [Yamadazyma tenuis]
MANKGKKKSKTSSDADGIDLFNEYLSGENGEAANDVPQDQVIQEIFSAKETVHADDAIDYEGIDELADEEDLDDISGDGFPVVSSEPDATEQQAEQDFDDIFGGGDDDDQMDSQNNRLLDGHLDNDPLMGDDGFGNIGIGDIYQENFEDEDSSRKRSMEEDQDYEAKRARLERAVKKLESRQSKRNLRYYYPTFKAGKVFNNHELFITEPQYYSFSVPPIMTKPKPLVPTKVSLQPDFDQRKVFRTGKYPYNYTSQRPNVTEITSNDIRLLESIQENGGLDAKKLVPLSYLQRDGTNDDKFREFSKDLILAVTDWDDEAIINGASKSTATKPSNQKGSSINLDLTDEVEEEEEDENIFNGHIDTELIKLDMNDPNLLFENLKPNTKIKEKLRQLASIPSSNKLLNLKFNISNDKQYEIFKSNYNVKVRSQIGNLNIEHSVPALRLQSPYYKVKLTNDEARSFHRPRFTVRPGTLISFSKVKARKRKKDKGKTSKELFAKSTDLTAGDNTTIISMEYTEEYPMILSNYGMGSKLINYYRREKPDDNSRPKAPLGETHVLGVEDRSPFWNFGYVEKGDFVPTLYNNMIRAPIFKHETKSTDFVLVRSQGGGNHQKYYLKSLDHIFSVGHTFPSVEVPAPHSRKVTNTSKNRLKMIVFRTMNKKGRARINVKDISHHFPDQNDMQNRQRLKEFMEYQRHGEDQYYWKIKNRDTAPEEESIRMMISPEDVALLDSMQAGQQLLDDLSIFLNEEQEKAKVNKEKIQQLEADKENEDDSTTKGKEKDKKKERKEKKEDAEEGIDEQLTSWNLTKNFVSANQAKSMLQLNGEGDPTGIGIGYSFLKTSQKSSFSPLFPPPKENVPKSNQAAYQARLYEEEITRIWYTQRKSLTVDRGKSLQSIYEEYKPLDHDQYLKKKYEDVNSDLTKGNKTLKINRRSRDKNGIVQRKVEVIKDPRIIKAYLKRKKQIEDDLIKNTDLEDILPTNDKELNKIRKKALEEKLANLERRAKHHKGRKSATAKDPLQSVLAAGGKAIDANTVVLPDGSYAIRGKGIGKGKSTTRRCAACGAFGHIRTKKSCPLYNQTQGGTIDIKPPEESGQLEM